MKEELWHDHHALGVADHIGLKGDEKFDCLVFTFLAYDQNFIDFVLGEILISRVGHIYELLESELLFLVVENNEVKMVDDVKVLDPRAFYVALFGLNDVGEVEFVQRFNLERLILVDHCLGFSVVPSRVLNLLILTCDIVIRRLL